MKPLLWSFQRGKEADYFYIGEPFCVECKQEILFEAYYVSSWHQRDTRHELFCLHCMGKMKERLYISQERRLVRLANNPPAGSVPVSMQHHGWTDANMNTFMAADQKYNARMKSDTNSVQLNTRNVRYSGRADYTVTDDDAPSLVGKTVEQLEIESDWKKDTPGLLSFHADEKNILLPETKERRLLR